MWPILPQTLPSALEVLAAMITPALLISACGTFILSTSNRLGRVVDRARVVSDKMEELMRRESEIEMLEERRSMFMDHMDKLSVRAKLLQRTLTVLYLASAVFVATSVAIGILSVFGSHYVWLPLAMGIGGACFLFYGSVMLIFEARLAVATMESEMSFLAGLVRRHNRTSGAG